MRGLAAKAVLEAIRQPVLVLAAENDKLVDYDAARRGAKRLARGELVHFGEEARHEILREHDGVRDRALAAIDEFLDRAAPQLK